MRGSTARLSAGAVAFLVGLTIAADPWSYPWGAMPSRVLGWWAVVLLTLGAGAFLLATNPRLALVLLFGAPLLGFLFTVVRWAVIPPFDVAYVEGDAYLVGPPSRLWLEAATEGVRTIFLVTIVVGAGLALHYAVARLRRPKAIIGS